ncbi:glycosyltransferase 87 family protein [Polaromonas sp. YR568]|uniref:glycosyltransferase 87 family protein n=1 Tax=Polaromonas sp. YR568 TaxID=1855301 RepID=UPI003137843C
MPMLLKWLSLATCVVILAWAAQSKSMGRITVGGVNYVGALVDGKQETSPRLTGPVAINEIDHPGVLKDLDISFKFITNEPTFSYGNLFQTGDSIDAIRMELQPSSNLVLVLSNGKVFPLSKSIQIGRYYGISLRYEKNDFLKVFIDGVEALNITDKRALAERFDMSNIVVGAGLAKQRTLLGTVKNFQINSSYSYYDTAAKLSRWLLTIMLSVALLCSLPYKTFPGIAHAWGGQWISWYKSFRAKLNPIRPLESQEKVAWVATIVCVGTMLSIVFHYIKNAFAWAWSPAPGTGWMSTMFHYPANIFCDFFRVYDLFSRSGLGGESNYFPFAALFLGLFGWMGQGNSYRAVAFYLLFASIIAFWVSWRFLRANCGSASILYTFVIFMMSYPFLFTIHTANLEILVYIFTALFFLFYTTDRPLTAVAFLAAAISMKAYPAIFVVLFLTNKSYRYILYTAAWTLVMSLLPFMFWPTTLDLYLDGLIKGMAYYNSVMVESTSGISFGHSILNSFRTIWPDVQTKPFMPIYYIVSGMSLLSLTGYAIVSAMEFWKKIAVLCIALCLLTPTSTDYKLLFFFIPCFYFITNYKTAKTDVLYTILFGLLFISKGYLYFNGNQFMSLNNLMNTAIMICMLGVIFVENILVNAKRTPSIIEIAKQVRELGKPLSTSAQR